jgi:hypothetical protein
VFGDLIFGWHDMHMAMTTYMALSFSFLAALEELGGNLQSFGHQLGVFAAQAWSWLQI